NISPKRNARKNHQLRARIESGYVLCRISLRIAQRLCFFQHGSKLRSLLHLAQNEVAGAVQNAFDAGDAIAGQPLLYAWNHRDTASHSRAVKQVASIAAGQFIESNSLLCNE